MAWQDSLQGEQRDAAAAVVSLFTQYGLESLATTIVDYARKGYAPDTMSLLLQDTAEFKQRFKANETRRAKGLPVLSPAEYLATEKSYRQIMSNAGLPAGFYDQPEDFRSFLEGDVSPQEVQGRVRAAADFVNSAPAEAKAVLREWYTTGDMIAYALDPERATSSIEKAYRAADLAGRASSQGLAVSRGVAESVGALGLTADQSLQGVANVASEAGNAAKLAALGGTTLTADDLIRETFLGDASVAEKRRKLASAERGRFGGSSGIGVDSLASTKGGQL